MKQSKARAVLSSILILALTASSLPSFADNDTPIPAVRRCEVFLNRITSANEGANESAMLESPMLMSAIPKSGAIDHATKTALGISILKQFLSKIAPENSKWIRIFPDKDPLKRKSRMVLDIVAAQDGGFEIPAIVSDAMKEKTAEREAKEADLEKQVALLERKLKEVGVDYRPQYFREMVKAVEEVVDSSKFMQGNQILDPLIQIVLGNSADLLQVLDTSRITDESVAFILADLVNPVRDGRLPVSDPAIHAALLDVATVSLLKWQAPLSEETMKTLRGLAYAGVPGLNNVEKANLSNDLLNYQQSVNDLETARDKYSKHRMAAEISYDRLRRLACPDGYETLETGNLMRSCWYVPGDMMNVDYSAMREDIINGVTKSGNFWHPALKKSVHVDWDAVDAHKLLSDLGSDHVDPYLLSQVIRWENFQREDLLSHTNALKQEIQTIQGYLTDRNLGKAEDIVAKMEKKVGQTIAGDLAASIGKVPAAFLDEIFSKADPGKATPDNKDTSAKKDSKDDLETQAGILAVPADLPAFLNAQSVRSPWGKKSDQKLDFSMPDGDPSADAAATDPATQSDDKKSDDASAKKKAVHPQSDGRAYSYLMNILFQLENVAKDVNASDLADQQKYFLAGTDIPPRVLTNIAHARGNLLTSLQSILGAFKECMLSHGATPEQTEDTFLDLLDVTPMMQRLLLSHAKGLGLADLQVRYIMNGLRMRTSRFVPLDARDSWFATYLDQPWARMAKERIRHIVLGTVVTVSAWATWHFWGDGIKHYIHEHTAGSPPAVTAPAEPGNKKDAGGKPDKADKPDQQDKPAAADQNQQKDDN